VEHSILSFRALCAAASLAACSATATAQVEFFGLGVSADGFSNLAEGVNADGTVVMGRNFGHATGDVPLRWVRGIGLEYLPTQFGLIQPFVRAVSGDGRVIGADGAIAQGVPGIVKWSSAGGRQFLQPLPGDTYASIIALSSDGSTTLGNSTGSPAHFGYHPVLWMADGSMQDLTVTGPVTQQYTQVYSWGMSSDGSVVAGWASQISATKAFRWTHQTGVVTLGALPGESNANALGISADGSTIIGFSNGLTGTRACKWIGLGPAESLGELPDSQSTIAYSVSGDGSIIVGTASMQTGNVAWVWTAQMGMVDLQSFLAFNGTNLNDWTLTYAKISADGRTFVGNGGHRLPSGQIRSEGWVAVIPAPSVACTLSISIACASRRRQRVHTGV
jgi:uncharacterized membrane protein